MVTHDEVRQKLLKGFCGGKEEEGCIDLSEITAILLAPFLLKARKEIDASLGQDGARPALVREYIEGSKSESDFQHKWEFEEFLRKCRLSEQLTPPNLSKIVADVLAMMLHDKNGPTSSADNPPCWIRDCFMTSLKLMVKWS